MPGGTTGVGAPTPAGKGEEAGGKGGPSGDVPSGPVPTSLNGLQNYLEKIGRDDLWNNYIKGLFAATMGPTQKAAERAQKAAKEMRGR